MKTLNIFLVMFFVLVSYTFAVSDWQTSVYSSEVGLQITYPKLDFYSTEQPTIVFNFNVFDMNNTHLDNDTTQCAILIFKDNGTRIVNYYLLWDGLNFYYVWNKTNYTEPESFYYTLFCNEVVDQTIIAKGFTSNNFYLNYDGRDPTFNTNYVAVVLIMVGLCFLFMYISNSLDERHGILKLLLLSFVILLFLMLVFVSVAIFRGSDITTQSITFLKTNMKFIYIIGLYVVIFLFLYVLNMLGVLEKIIKPFMRNKK